jgi:hypothetical protein
MHGWVNEWAQEWGGRGLGGARGVHPLPSFPFTHLVNTLVHTRLRQPPRNWLAPCSTGRGHQHPAGQWGGLGLGRRKEGR